MQEITSTANRDRGKQLVRNKKLKERKGIPSAKEWSLNVYLKLKFPFSILKLETEVFVCLYLQQILYCWEKYVPLDTQAIKPTRIFFRLTTICKVLLSKIIRVVAALLLFLLLLLL